MRFDLNFPNNRLDSFDEGVEFGFRNLNVGNEWVPLFYYTSRSVQTRDEEISIGDLTMDDSYFNLRGYNVSFSITSTTRHNVRLKICGSEVIQNDAIFNFRWLQTIVGIAVENLDETLLDNIQISTSPPQNCALLMEDFSGQDSIKYAAIAN